VVPTLEQASKLDRDMLEIIANAPATIGAALEQYRFREAGSLLMAVAREANKYFNDSAPWASRTSAPQQCANTIHVALQISATLSILCEPFLPFTAARIRRMLGITGVRSSERSEGGTASGIGWNDAGQSLLKSGQRLGEPEILFTKIEDEVIQTQIDKLQATQKPAAPGSGPAQPYSPLAPAIQFDDFQKLDLRVGRVLSAEPVPKSKKLLRCEVDLGFERRQVLAGVAEHLAPADLVGKNVVVVANLAPRKMLGLESQGMLLMAKNREGQLVPVLAASEPGSTVS
jgi:methionyl-tRNA synthetase